MMRSHEALGLPESGVRCELWASDDSGDWTSWLHSSAEEGRALAQGRRSRSQRRGWCDRSLRKPPIECFVSQTCIFDTKRSNDEFRVTLQTTPVPLRDRCRCAAHPLLISGEPEKRPISR